MFTFPFLVSVFILLVFEVAEVHHQNTLESKEEVEEAAEVDDKVLCSKGEDCRVNHIFCVSLVEEGVREVILDKV